MFIVLSFKFFERAESCNRTFHRCGILNPKSSDNSLATRDVVVNRYKDFVGKRLYSPKTCGSPSAIHTFVGKYGFCDCFLTLLIG